MRAINLTPHAITIRVDCGDICVPPSGMVARVAVRSTDRNSVAIDGCSVPVIANEYEAVEGLPENRKDYELLLVSSLVLGRLAGSGARNVYAPDTGPTAIRNTSGQIEAVTRLVCPE